MSQPSNVSLSYRDAGVDIDAGDALVEAIKPFAKRTMREGVLGGIGMTVIVSKENADAAMAQLQAAGETVYRIGEIRARAEGEHQTIVR